MELQIYSCYTENITNAKQRIEIAVRQSCVWGRGEMISVFLVEDERIPRESIKKNVQWKENGIEFLGDASDGEIALPQILAKKPDILLTDIKMPFMDGLELAQIVRNKLPDTKIIILSGYNEFDYARQAISLGISDYLLKPISSTDIICAVDKVRGSIEDAREERQERSGQAQVQREVFFSSLYSGFLSGTRQILSRAEQLSIPLAASAYCVTMAGLTPSAEPGNEATRRILYDTPDALASGFDGTKIVYLLQAEDDAALEQKQERLKKRVQDAAARQSLQLQWTQGAIVHRLSDIAESYQTANLRCGRQHSECKTAGLSESAPFENDALLDFLRTGKASSVEAFWENYRPAIEGAFASFIYRCYLYTELFFVIRQFAGEIHMEVPAVLTENDILEKRIAADSSADDFISFGCNLCRQAMAARSHTGMSRYTPAVEQARQYIEQHFMDAALSLTTVADAVHLSPNHFSTVFKEKTGVGFSEYLTDIRIRQAKRLLCTTNLRASEVGEHVGYLNMNYFSMLFKKVTGMSPGQYRRECEK